MKPSHLAQSARLSRLLGLFVVSVLIGCAGGTPQVVGDDDDQPPPPMVKQPPMPKDGSSTAPGCEGIPESGVCQDGVATYCDVEGNELRRKDCRALGKSCVVDAQAGAKCEAVEGGGGTGGACGNGVTNEGSCSGQTATWCDEFSGQTIVWDCAGDGLTCQTDTCTTSNGTAIPGAYCCGAGGAMPPPSNECPALGFAGECNGAGEAKWCNGDQLVTKTCTGGQTCQVDACAEGAYCCDVAPPPVSECDQIGFEGVCTATGPKWCSNGQIMEVSCSAGTTCQLNVCGTGAYCCAP